MSQEDYDRLYLGLNVASTVCTIAGSALRSWRGSNCFIAGTLVMTAAGLKKIEDLKEGDLVLAYDEETGEQTYKEVVRLFRNKTKEWYHVRVHGEEIICTGGHPFYVLNASENRNTVCYESAKADTAGKWVTAKELQISDKLLLSDGSCAIIEEIKVEQLATPETTYNFEVEDFHTYYVTESAILVHNACPVGSALPDEGVPNSTALRYDTEGKLYTAKTYGNDGRVLYRIDFQGKPHYCVDIGRKAIPHVHPITYDLGIYYRELDAVSLDYFIRNLL